MTPVQARRDAKVKVCALGELEKDRVRVVSAEGRIIAVFIDQGKA